MSGFYYFLIHQKLPRLVTPESSIESCLFDEFFVGSVLDDFSINSSLFLYVFGYNRKTQTLR